MSGGDDGTVAVHVSVTPELDETLYLKPEAATIADEETGTSGVVATDSLTSIGYITPNTDSDEEGTPSIGRVGGTVPNALTFAICAR